MKKLILIACAFVGLLSSCKNGTQGGAVYYVYMINTMESLGQGSRIPVVTHFKYSDLTGTPSINNTYKDFPRLVEQTITGDTLNKITYGYTAKSIACTRYAIDETKYYDSLSIDARGMANGIWLENNKTTPYYIQYSTDGYRTKVADTTFRMGTMNSYHTAFLGSDEIAEYSYTTSPNFIGLQQYGIYGSPYYWATDQFGAQSDYLLSEVTKIENGVPVKYTFSYQLNINGFVSQETILRNDLPFMVNKYTYVMAMIVF